MKKLEEMSNELERTHLLEIEDLRAKYEGMCRCYLTLFSTVIVVITAVTASRLVT